MNPIRKFTVLPFVAVVLTSAAACSDKATLTDEATTTDTLVSAEWLKAHIDDPNLIVIDATVLVTMDAHGNYESVSGRDEYEKGHVPGAVFADLKDDLRNSESELEFGLPSPQEFAASMGALGVGDESFVVIYDNMGSSWAARIWWMLRWVGFDNAALLDGGLDAWTTAGGELSTAKPAFSPATLTIELRSRLIADQDEVRASITDSDINLVDALYPAHYRGEMAMYEQPGHIPGARNIPVTSLFSESGQFRSQEKLAAILDGEKDKRTITYCGGGIAASTDAFALVRAGYTDVAIYAASLEEWAANPDNPMDVVLEFDDE